MEIVIVSIIAVVTLLLWIFFFVKFKKQYSPDVVLNNIRTEIDKMLIDISQETDRDITLIENRIESLRAIIITADKKIEELNKRIITYKDIEEQRAFEKKVMKNLSEEDTAKVRKKNPVQRAASSYLQNTTPEIDFAQTYPEFSPTQTPLAQNPSTQSPVTQQTSVQPLSTPPVHGGINFSFDENLQTENSKIEKPKAEKPTFTVSKETTLSPASIKRHIIEMSAEGFSADLIAERLGISITEVEMIIYMYGRS